MTSLEPVYWHVADPGRLARDMSDIADFAPGLDFEPGPGDGPLEHHGIWRGLLPLWPFDRPEPEGLSNVVPTGLVVEVRYTSAHPMLPPSVYPLDPVPGVWERGRHDWHVAPDASLCLLQSYNSWDPRWSVAELLRRACGWRIEFALMRAEAVKKMTLHSIVDNDSLDALISEVAAKEPAASAKADGAEDSEAVPAEAAGASSDIDAGEVSS